MGIEACVLDGDKGQGSKNILRGLLSLEILNLETHVARPPSPLAEEIPSPERGSGDRASQLCSERTTRAWRLPDSREDSPLPAAGVRICACPHAADSKRGQRPAQPLGSWRWVGSWRPSCRPSLSVPLLSLSPPPPSPGPPGRHSLFTHLFASLLSTLQ